jgi:hypothetical protein
MVVRRHSLPALFLAFSLACAAAEPSGVAAPAALGSASLTLSGTDGVWLHSVALSPVVSTNEAGSIRFVFVHLFSESGVSLATVVCQVAATSHEWVSCQGELTPSSTRSLRVRPRVGLAWGQVQDRDQLEFMFNGSAS